EALPWAAAPAQRAAARFLTNTAGNFTASAIARGAEAAFEGKPIGEAVADVTIPGVMQDIAFAGHGALDRLGLDQKAVSTARDIVNGTTDNPVYAAHIEAARSATTPEEKANVALSLRSLTAQAHDVLEQFGQKDADPVEAGWWREVEAI